MGGAARIPLIMTLPDNMIVSDLSKPDVFWTDVLNFLGQDNLKKCTQQCHHLGMTGKKKHKKDLFSPQTVCFFCILPCASKRVRQNLGIFVYGFYGLVKCLGKGTISHTIHVWYYIWWIFMVNGKYTIPGWYGFSGGRVLSCVFYASRGRLTFSEMLDVFSSERQEHNNKRKSNNNNNNNNICVTQINYGQILATKPPLGHPKWWWKVRESPPKMPLIQVYKFRN